MHVSVNGVRLFFDVEGTKFVPDGPAMRERPTLLLLHGGPGADHSIYRPAYSALSDIAEIVYLGELISIRLDLPSGQELWCRHMATRFWPEEGATTNACWRPEDVRILPL